MHLVTFKMRIKSSDFFCSTAQNLLFDMFSLFYLHSRHYIGTLTYARAQKLPFYQILDHTHTPTTQRHTHTRTHVCMAIPCEDLDSVLYLWGLPLWRDTGCSYCIHKHVWALCLSASLGLGFEWNGLGSNQNGHFTLLMRTSCEDLLIIITFSIYTFLERTVGASWFNLWCMSSIAKI